VPPVRLHDVYVPWGDWVATPDGLSKDRLQGCRVSRCQGGTGAYLEHDHFPQQAQRWHHDVPEIRLHGIDLSWGNRFAAPIAHGRLGE